MKKWFRTHFGDKGFILTVFSLVFPVAIQNFLAALLHIINTMMLGQLGDLYIAAMGLAGQLAFTLNMIIFGLASALSVFVSQYWGAGDRVGIRRTMTLLLILNTIVGGVYVFLAMGIPEAVLSLYSKDAEAVALGAQYLRIVAPSYLAVGYSATLATTLKSTGQARLQSNCLRRTTAYTP